MNPLATRGAKAPPVTSPFIHLLVCADLSVAAITSFVACHVALGGGPVHTP